MQNNAVRYIHARRLGVVNVDVFNNRIVKTQQGGMTFAWMVSDDSNLHVSVPAVCRDDDNYVRVAGAGLSRQNLNEKDVLFCVTKAELIEETANSFQSTLQNIGDMNAAGIVEAVQKYREALERLPLVRNLSPRFFEEVIRTKLRSIYANKPYAI